MSARIPGFARSATIAVALLVVTTRASAQQESKPLGPAPAGADVLVIIPDSLDATPRTLTELLRDYVPSASVQRSSGALGASAWVSFRDAAAVRGDDPLLVIDGIRQVGYRTRLDTLNRRAPSLLDDIMLEDVARVEVLSGPAAAASYGYEGQRGVIVVTTRSPGGGRPELRASITTSATADNPGYTRNLSRVSATGVACPYFYEAAGACTATSTTRYTPLLDRGAFRSAQQARVHIGASGGLGALGYAVALGFHRGTGTMDANAADRTTGSLRLNMPLARAIRVGLVAFATERGVTTPVEGAGSLIANGLGGGPIDCSATTPCGLDSSSGGYRSGPAAWIEQQEGPRRRIDHFGQAVTLAIEPGSRLALHTTVSGDLLRDRVSNLDSATSQAVPAYESFSRARAKERNWRVGASQEARLTTDLGPLAGTTSLSIRFDAERSRDERSTFFNVAPTSPYGGTFSATWAQAGLRRDRTEWALDQRLAWGDRASIGAGAIRTTTRLWKAFDHLSTVLDPHADAVYQLVPAAAPLGFLTSFRLRTAYSEASGYDARFYADVRGLGMLPSPYVYGGYGYLQGPRHEPDRSTELEGGFDASFSIASSRLSVTAFRRHDTVRLLFPIVIETQNINAALTRRVTGAALVAEATPIDGTTARLHLRGQLALNHDRTGGFPPGVLAFAGSNDVALSIADGESWGAWWTRGFGWNDANGNGRIDANELLPGDRTPANGRSRPSRFASLTSGLEFARSFTLTAIADHVGGFDVYDLTSAMQCARLVCPALNDPKASLSDQARAVAIAGRASSAGFVVPGDAVRLRELSLSYRSPRAAVAVRASSLRVTLSAYDVASWTRSKGVHPETDIPAPGDRENSLWSAVQPIPRTFALRVALVY